MTQAVCPFIKLCYVVSSCAEITHSKRFRKEVLEKRVFIENVRVLFNEKRERVAICLRFCRRNRMEETTRKTYAYMGLRGGAVG